MKKIYFGLLLSLFLSKLFAQGTNGLPPVLHNPVIPLNGNGSLGLSYDNAACGLNYVAVSHLITTLYNQYAISSFGIGLPAVYAVSGVPPCSNILKVFAYWGVSYQFGSSTSPSISVTNPNSQNSSFVASLIGQAGPKCWGEVGTRSFRADI